MTVIFGALHNGQLVIKGDRLISNDAGSVSYVKTKVHRMPFGALGFSGSVRAGQIICARLAHLGTGPRLKERIVDAVIETLKANGWEGSSGDSLPSCTELELLIVTSYGDLWTIQDDLSIIEHDRFAAIGSGEQAAIAAAHAIKSFARDALELADKVIYGVCRALTTCERPAEAILIEQTLTQD